MDTKQIAYLINNPSSINNEDVSTIEDVKNQFPYCSSLHMLFIKGLANTNSVNFEKELKKSAVNVNNREILHELINSKTSAIKLVQEQIKPKVTPQINKVDTSQINTTTSSSISTPNVQESIETKTIPSIKDKPTSDKVDMAKIIEEIRLKAELARFKQNKEKDKSSNETKTEIEKPITIKTTSTTKPIIVNKEVVLNSIKSTVHEPNLNVNILANAMSEAFELDVDNIIRESDEASIENQTTTRDFQNIDFNVTKEDEIDVSTLSFIDWLKYKQGKLKTINSIIEKKDPIEKKQSIKLTKKEIDTLLNKFIDEEPKMAKPQTEFFNPLKNAKQSLDESKVLVSETLAKIYWMQKKYNKAIRAYEQLSLLNPEKNTFFANQIKKIKQELN